MAMPKSRPTALELPTEILRKCFAFAAGPPNVWRFISTPYNSAFINLATVHSSWKPVVYDLLYGQLSIGWRYTSVQLLLRSLKENPLLGSWVVSFEACAFGLSDLSDVVDRYYREELDAILESTPGSHADVFDIYDERVRYLKDTHPDMKWIDKDAYSLVAASEESCVVLSSLIAQFPNLTRLSLANFPFFPNPSPLSPIFNQLVYLELYGISSFIAHSILVHTRNLISLSHTCSPNSFTSPPDPPYLPHVKHLMLPILADTYCQSISTAHASQLTIFALNNYANPLSPAVTTEFSSAPAIEYLYLDLSTRVDHRISISAHQRFFSTCTNLRHLVVFNFPLEEILSSIASSTELSTIHYAFIATTNPARPTILPETIVPQLLANSTHLTSLRKLHVQFPDCAARWKARELKPSWVKEAKERGIDFKFDFEHPGYRIGQGALDRSLEDFRNGP